MKKLFALLIILFVPDVYAQEAPTQITVGVASGTGIDGTVKTYSLDTTTIPLSNINSTITNGMPLYLGDDNTSTVTLPFTFNFFGNNYNNAIISSNGFLSFINHGNGCCDGVQLPNTNWSNSIFAAWADLVDPLSPFIRSSANEFDIGWYTKEYGTQNLVNFEISLFSNNNFMINYGNMTQSGNHVFTAGIMGNTATEYYQIYNGNNVPLLSNKTFTFLSDYKPPTVDCTLTPSDTSCIIKSMTSPTSTTVPQAVKTAINTNISSIVDTTPSVQELATNDTIVGSNTTDIASSLSTSSVSPTIQSLTDASPSLSDNIDKNILSIVLSVIDTPTQQTSTPVKNTSSVAQESSISNTDNTQEAGSDTQDLTMDILNNGIAMNNATQQEIQSSISQSDNSNTNDTSSIEESILAINKADISVNDNTVSFEEQPNTSSENNFSEYVYVNTTESESTVDPIVDQLINNIINGNKSIEKNDDVELVASLIDNSIKSQAVSIDVTTFTDTLINNGISTNNEKKEEDKSDAEKRAEKVIAANKEEQEAINKNYMDADQSGLIGAIAGDADITSYRNAMLPDNNVWYKPDDIYKNITYKDNSRSLYFLEKGNTDMYNKMVQDQYK